MNEKDDRTDDEPVVTGEVPALPDGFKGYEPESYGFDRPCKRCGTISPHYLCRDCYNDVGE